MDGSEAFVLKFQEGDRLVKHIHSKIESHERFKGEGKDYTRFGNVYIDPEKRNENPRDHAEVDYFERIARELHDVDAFIVFGPAQMKDHFSKWAKEHSELSKKIAGTLTTEKMSENQMFAFILDQSLLK